MDLLLIIITLIAFIVGWSKMPKILEEWQNKGESNEDKKS